MTAPDRTAGEIGADLHAADQQLHAAAFESRRNALLFVEPAAGGDPEKAVEFARIVVEWWKRGDDASAAAISSAVRLGPRAPNDLRDFAETLLAFLKGG
jgi:hypothetical protein